MASLVSEIFFLMSCNVQKSYFIHRKLNYKRELLYTRKTYAAILSDAECYKLKLYFDKEMQKQEETPNLPLKEVK